MEALPTVIAFLGGGTVTAIIVWLRFRRIDQATASKTHAEAYSTIHSSDANALHISSGLVAMWMKDASEAKTEIIELRSQLSKCTCSRGSNGR
jgi:hypothetical protein